MNRVFFLIMICLPFLGKAQDGKGIRFEEGLTWQQVQAKAKAENKYIFLDCYAAWCEPCKKMDQDVYPSEKVGNYMNTRFISVKAQMDTSKQDNEQIKRWYADAHDIMYQHNITVFPSFLFFSPSGRIVHKALGFKNMNDFITLAANASNPDKQYYTLLKNYREGNKNYVEMPYLATVAKSLKERDLANTVARDYLVNLFSTLKEDEFFTKEIIEFIYSFDQILSSKDKGFDLFYRYGDKIDDLMKSNGLSKSVVDYIITKEEIKPILDLSSKNGTNPNWGKSFKNIKRKYGVEYANRTVLGAKVNFYEEKKDWSKCTKYFIMKVEKCGLDTANLMSLINLNTIIWDCIFLHSNDKRQINAGIEWMECVIKSNPKVASWLDTYANLLYKVGRKRDALTMEEKASALAPNDKEIQETFEKMKSGIPTWLPD